MRWSLLPWLLSALLAAAPPPAEPGFTRGVGVYPGDPAQYAGPLLQVDASSYRNLALHRPAYQSSAYDYNLTAQLVTDGIRGAAAPRFLEVATSCSGLLRRSRREQIFNGNWVSELELDGAAPWVQFRLGGGAQAPEVDRLAFRVRLRNGDGEPENVFALVRGSQDGQEWRELGRVAGMTRRGEGFQGVVELPRDRWRYYRLCLETPRLTSWLLGQAALSCRGQAVPVGGPFQFDNAWKSAGAGPEWVYVDLGAPCAIDRVVLDWIQRPAAGELQVSGDAAAWTPVRALPGSGTVDDLRFPTATARFVRVRLDRPALPDGYVLGQFEVYGRGGPLPQAQAAPAPDADGGLELTRGAWKLQRDSLARGDGTAISRPGYADGDWLPATVPGTILASYLNAGALPDPDYGDNQLLVSDAFFYADFWYRDSFTAPPLARGRRQWLVFDGIDWKALVFLNGHALGRIEGAFTRARFDVTGLVRPGQANALAVLVQKNDHPGCVKEKDFEGHPPNGGALGLDNPTFHAAIGWDWIPTIRGRDTGLWGRVALEQTGPVTLGDPAVASVLAQPDQAVAEVALTVQLRNHTREAVSGVLKGRFGEVPLERPLTLAPGGELTVRLDPASVPGLRIRHPRLWWPNGYGAPERYPVELRFETGGAVSDRRSFQAGIRQLGWSTANGALRLWINGRRFVPKGGSWGFSESMLRYRARDYDAAVRYHRDLHFNMIRNWVGQVGDDAFYDACDRYGLVVWQDFWLANPWDGEDPHSDGVFLANARDTVRRIRSHPSVGLYCGRNEGFPPRDLDQALRATLQAEHPDVPYLSSSADAGVGGRGPYQLVPLAQYFQSAPWKLHSEMGLPAIVSLDSLRRFLPEDRLWPQDRLWGVHDFGLDNAGGRSFIETGRVKFGPAAGAADWVALSQFLDYDGYRAMFEAQAAQRMGLLVWMSHPAWPSLVWQLYDYYLEPTAGYFGAKKACEPLHIQHNPATGMVEVVDYSAGDQRGLTATLQLLDQGGAVRWERAVPVDLHEDSRLELGPLERPVDLTPLYFIRLRLSRGSQVLSENLYLKGLEEDDTRRVRDLPKVRLEAVTRAVRDGDRWTLITELRNAGAAPALMVHLKPVRERSGDRILPAVHSDDYVTLMPGETRTLEIEVAQADTRGEPPRIVVEGFNLLD
jgi:beta-galactosidase/beta-glucuronidase